MVPCALSTNIKVVAGSTQATPFKYALPLVWGDVDVSPLFTQLHCLRLLYSWRDNLARTEDESTGYVLPNHMLFQISEILPREAQGVLACCNPIPTLLRQQLQEVYMLVQRARETPLDEPVC